MNEIIQLSEEQHRYLQLNELQLLVEVDRICRKYNIDYSLDGGTLLGAIRHQGFIPWDEDADVVFTRLEYAKFYEACKADLNTAEFFLQEYRTDPHYRWGTRDSDAYKSVSSNCCHDIGGKKCQKQM